jgi:hypothetical protein
MKRRTPTEADVRKAIRRGPGRPQRAIGSPKRMVSPATPPRAAASAKLIDLA